VSIFFRMFRMRNALRLLMDKVEIRLETLKESCIDEAVTNDPQFTKEWKTIIEDMQAVGHSLLLLGGVVTQTVMDVHAKISLNEAEPTDLDMEDELLKILQSLHNALDTFVHFPVCRWQVITGALKAFYHKHQPTLLAGGVVGAVCAGAPEWALLRQLLASCSPGCAVAVIETTAADIALMLLGAVGGIALTGLLIWGVIHFMEKSVECPRQRELNNMKGRLARLREGPAPSLESIRDLRLRLTGLITDVIDAEGHQCWLCHDILTNCTAHLAGSPHLDTCAIFHYECQHPVCHNCAGRWGECGLCKAKPCR
jgi:hypothetical protein